MSKNLVQINRGYSRTELEGFLGVTRGQVRYWRKNLDPLPERSYFSGPVVLVYRAIKYLVIDMNISVKKLHNFHDVFKKCVETSFKELSNKEIIYDFRTREVKLQDVSERLGTKNRRLGICYAHINLGALFEEHILSLAYFGVSEQLDLSRREEDEKMKFLKLVASNS